MNRSVAGQQAVEMAVVNSRLEGVVRAMMNTLLRTARSGVLNQARDFSCCILTADHGLLAAADSLPIHVMSGPDLMARSMVEHHPALRRGDAFLHNSPYEGGSHPADHSILVPVLDSEGVHRLTVVAKGHQADIGNSKPTTYMAGARDVYEEGALIFPCVRVQRDYENVDDVIRMCRARIRVPDQWWGDYLALLGAARVGERRLGELADELGWEGIDEQAERWFDYSEQRMSAALSRLPAGRIELEGRHDPVDVAPEGVVVKASIEIDPTEPRVTIDLRDNGDQLECGLNLSEACAKTAAMIGIFNALPEAIPANAGSFRPLGFEIRPGSIAGGVRHPYSCSAATTNLADRLANAVQRSLAELLDGYGLAEAGLAMPPSLPVISGRDKSRGGERFVNQICLASTGGPGGPEADGWLTIVHVGNAGVLLRDSVETDEHRYPLRVVSQRLQPDTEGAGRNRGAPSVEVVFEATTSELEVIFACDGNTEPALGARGGLPGGRSAQRLRRADGETVVVGGFATAMLKPGEAILATTCGGGGYGPPAERAPGAVCHDVAEGWVSAERARNVYRVAIDADGAVDAEATIGLRAGGEPAR